MKQLIMLLVAMMFAGSAYASNAPLPDPCDLDPESCITDPPPVEEEEEKEQSFCWWFTYDNLSERGAWYVFPFETGIVGYANFLCTMALPLQLAEKLFDSLKAQGVDVRYEYPDMSGYDRGQ